MMTKKGNIMAIGLIIVAIIAVGALSLVGGNNDTQKEKVGYSASVLVAVAEQDFDFGTINMKDGDVSHRFEFKNEGKESVVIEKGYTSCMCTRGEVSNSLGDMMGVFGMQGHGLEITKDIEVLPGESVVIDAIFDPAAHGPSGIGLAERSIYLETNSKESLKLELSFRAMVTR